MWVVFFDVTRKATEVIARLERLILAWGVEMGECHLEREEFITLRENELKLLWEKRNSINECEKEIQKAPSSNQGRGVLLGELESDRKYNDSKIEPRIQFLDAQIEIIDARLLELQVQLRTAHSELEQQREILARFRSPVAGAQNQREQSASIPSATPAA